MMFNDQFLVSKIKFFAQKSSNKKAIVFRDEKISYTDLLDTAQRYATLFINMGLQEQKIAIHLANSIDLAILYVAAMLAGVTVVPISIDLKAPEIFSILEETLPVAFMGDEQSHVFLEQAAKDHYIPEKLLTIDKGSSQFFTRISLPKEIGELPKIKPDLPAAIFFTSGSTSKPKGVIHSQKSLSAMMDSMADALDLTANESFLMAEPMSNCSGYVQSLLPLFVGSTVIIMPFFSTEELLKGLEHQPEKMSLMGEGNFKIIEDQRIFANDFRSLRVNLTGGDRISKQLMSEFKEKTNTDMRLGYGMSECLLITVNKRTDQAKLGSIGSVAKNTQIQLRDQNLCPVLSGQVGEVWIKGPHCTIGYWNEQKLTEDSIIDGWFRTGDLAKEDEDHFFWFCGRIKQLIIRNGDNISPFEIEEVLNQHPAVSSVGVIGVDHPQEGQVPYAFVELKKTQDVSPEELYHFITEKLEDNKIPEKILILDNMPRTLTGKVDRKNLIHFKD